MLTKTTFDKFPHNQGEGSNDSVNIQVISGNERYKTLYKLKTYN